MLTARPRPCFACSARASVRSNVRAIKQKRHAQAPSAEMALFLAAAAVAAEPAKAVDVDIDGAVDVTVGGVKAIGEAIKALGEYGQSALGFAADSYSKVQPQVDDAIRKATPVVKGAYDEVQKVAVPALNEATSKGIPIIQKTTRDFLTSSGVDVDAVSRSAADVSTKASGAFQSANPYVNKVTNFLTTSSPETLAKAGIALIAVYYLTPFAIKSLISGLRGYSGEITPARAVDLVQGDDNVAIIDIRPLKEKAAVGVPDVPSSARGRFIELEVAEIDRRLRGQLRAVDAVESQITALEVQALKRVSKGSQILLIDKNGGSTAKSVAKELSKLGFRSVFVVAGGFSGWQSSKLQVKPPVPGAKSQSNGIGGILGTISTRKPEKAAK